MSSLQTDNKRSDIKRVWYSLHPLLRVWLALLLLGWLVLVCLPFTDTTWWYAPAQRFLKTRWDLTRNTVSFALHMTLLGIIVWAVWAGRNRDVSDR